MIRRGEPDDAPALARLRLDFRSSIKDPNIAEEETAQFLARCTEWMRTHLRRDDWFCWVVEDAGQIVGAIWLHIFEKVPNPWPGEAEHNGYITNFFVKAEFRGRGLGRELLNAALAVCKQHNTEAVVLWATTESRPIYERAGFKVPIRIMELSSGQPGHP